MAHTNWEVTVTARETRIDSVVVSVGGILRVAGLFAAWQSGVVPLRHRRERRAPTFVSHVHEIGTTDGVCWALATVAGLPLLETRSKVRSQVANVAGEDIRGVRNVGEFL